MTAIYKDFQSLAATLLRDFDQGGLALRTEVRDGPTYDPGEPISVKTVPFTGVVRGVNASLLTDSLIQSTDLIVMIPGRMNPKLTDKCIISGKEHQIVKVTGKPATGTVSVWECVVRS